MTQKPSSAKPKPKPAAAMLAPASVTQKRPPGLVNGGRGVRGVEHAATA
jgi:hypothetical protein